MRVMDRAEVMLWRKAERKKLTCKRLATPSDIRRHHADQIVASLEEVIPEAQGLIISAYWPFRGEPDLRNFMAGVSDRGGRCSLPVVVETGQAAYFSALESRRAARQRRLEHPSARNDHRSRARYSDRASRGLRPGLLSPRLWRWFLRPNARNNEKLPTQVRGGLSTASTSDHSPTAE